MLHIFSSFLNRTPLVLAGIALFFMVAGLSFPVAAQTREDVCDGLELTGATCDDPAVEAFCQQNPDDAACENIAAGQLSGVVRTALNIFSTVVGIVSVVMIVFAGFRYITSGGDSGKISTAQQTIIYAIVGLVIVGLAQVIVRFVVAAAS